MENLRLALVQTDLAWQAAAHNRELLTQLIRPLKGLADLIVLPEMFTSAFVTGSGALAEEHPGPTLVWMQQQAQELQAAITGSAAVTENGQRFNRLYFVTPDGVARYYDKRHLFRMLDEHKRYGAGQSKLLVEWQGWRILPLVCYDLRFPELYRQLQAHLLLVPSAFTHTTGQAHWEVLLRARAIENLAFVAAAAQGGLHDNGRRTWGHSMLIDPWGQVLSVQPEGAAVVLAALDPGQLKERRSQLPALNQRGEPAAGSPPFKDVC